MSEWLLPVLVLTTALAATYVCCLRPMRSGACHRSQSGRPRADDHVELQLREARAERDRLRAQ